MELGRRCSNHRNQTKSTITRWFGDWLAVVAHGLASLVAGGPLPHATPAHGVPLLTALLVSAGDAPDRCRRSVETGCSTVVLLNG